MPKENYAPSRAPRTAKPAAKRAVAPKWDTPKGDSARSYSPRSSESRSSESRSSESRSSESRSSESRSSEGRSSEGRSASPRGSASRTDSQTKRDGRKGYVSKKGDYTPKGDFTPRGERSYDPDRKPRTSDRPDRVQRDQSRDQEFSKARSTTGKTFQGDKKLAKLESSEVYETFATFQEMDLPERLTQELAKMGAATPFPIQAATIPAAMTGSHVLGRGKTGSGKTIAFGVPLVAFLALGGNQPRNPGKPKALVIAPTRELADQIDRTLSQLAKSVGFFTTVVYGGVPQHRQVQALKRGVDILIATPGRLEDLMAQGQIDLSECERVVVDEADHMCDLGFIEPVNRILEATGESQKLLFSATLDSEVAALVRKFMPKPFVYEVPGEVNESSDIEHRVLVIDPQHRSQVFHRLVQGTGKSIVFVRTKSTAEALAQSLNDSGVPTARLHGDLNQAQRTKNLERFTTGSARVMIATDVAARGIHVDDVKLVIQLDLPEEYKTYLHRAGRTGRAGRSGTVVSLVPLGRTRKAEGLLERADREAIYTQVAPGNPLLEELAGPIAPPPVVDFIDFGDSRFESMNKDRAKSQIRAKSGAPRSYASKDRKYRGR